MTVEETRSRKPWIIAGVAVLAGAAALWGLTGSAEEEVVGSLPKELSVESLKAQADDPHKMFENMRREDLTEEQRRELGHNIREVMRSEMDERVDEYFSASEAERGAVLDRHIDEMQKRREEWAARRREREQEREGDRERERDHEDRENRRRDFHNRFASQTQEERKARSESRSADDMGRRMAYMTAMRERMTERGIDGPRWGPGGGRGGPHGPGMGRGPGGGRGSGGDRGSGGGRGSGGSRGSGSDRGRGGGRP